MPVSSMTSAFFCALLFPAAKFRSSSHPPLILLSSSRRALVVPIARHWRRPLYLLPHPANLILPHK